MVWEKETREAPFGIIPLADVYKRYERFREPKGQYWATRPIVQRQ